MQFPTNRTATLTGHTGPVNCVVFSGGQGQYVLSGSSDRNIHLYNPAKAAAVAPSSVATQYQSRPSTTVKASIPGLVASFSAHGYEVLDLDVSEDNAKFVSVGGDRQVFLWDVSRGQTLRRWAGHNGKVNAVSFGGGGDVVVSGSFDATVRIWDCKSQSTKPIQVLDEAKDSISSIHVIGHEIVAGSVDGRVRIYDVRMGMIYVDVIGQAITSVQQTRDGNAVLVSALDSTVRLMDKGNGQLLQSYTGHVNKDYRIRSKLGLADSVVVSGSEDGQLFAWDLLEGKVLHLFKAPHAGKVASAVAFNGTKKEWASAGGDGTVALWGP